MDKLDLDNIYYSHALKTEKKVSFWHKLGECFGCSEGHFPARTGRGRGVDRYIAAEYSAIRCASNSEL